MPRAIKRLAVLKDSAVSSGVGQLASIQAVASRRGVIVDSLDIRDTETAEATLATFARPNDSGLIVLSATGALHHRERIVALTARHRLPAICPYRPFVASGGLIYGPDQLDATQRNVAQGQFRKVIYGAPVALTVRFCMAGPVRNW